MKVYYAHSMGLYNTPQEKRDIETLKNLNLEIVNPNNFEISNTFKKMCTTLPYLEAFDKVFGNLVKSCEVFAFKALPNGKIPGGVALELISAQKENKIIIELPSGMHSRIMGKEETIEYLRDMGER